MPFNANVLLHLQQDSLRIYKYHTVTVSRNLKSTPRVKVLFSMDSTADDTLGQAALALCGPAWPVNTSEALFRLRFSFMQTRTSGKANTQSLGSTLLTGEKKEKKSTKNTRVYLCSRDTGSFSVWGGSCSHSFICRKAGWCSHSSGIWRGRRAPRGQSCQTKTFHQSDPVAVVHKARSQSAH